MSRPYSKLITAALSFWAICMLGSVSPSYAAEPREACSSPAQREGSRSTIALVLAVSDYNGDLSSAGHNRSEFLPDLNNAVRDGEAVAQALCTVGANVIIVTDPTRLQMLAAFSSFMTRLAENPQASSVLYYSGHAMQVDNQNWLLPSLASLPIERDLARAPSGIQEAFIEPQGVRLQLILSSLASRAGNAMNLVVIDACRDNPWDRIWGRTRGAGGLARQEPPNQASVIVSYSTYSGGLAYDGPARGNSPFTSAFVALVPQRGLEIRDLLTQVDSRVRESTSGRQSVVTVTSSGQRLCLAGCSLPTQPAETQGRSGAAEVPSEARLLGGTQCILSQVSASDRRRYEEFAEQVSRDELDQLALQSAMGRLAPAFAVCNARLGLSEREALAAGQLVQSILMRPVFEAALSQSRISASELERWYRQQPAEFRNLPALDPERVRQFLRAQNRNSETDDAEDLDVLALLASQYLQVLALEDRLRNRR